MIERLLVAGIEVHAEPISAGVIRFVYFSAPDGVVVELTQYQLPAKLAPAVGFLKLFNRGVHLGKRAIARRMLDAI